MYLVVQGILRVPIGPKYPQDAYWSQISKVYLVVQDIERALNDSRNPKGTQC